MMSARKKNYPRWLAQKFWLHSHSWWKVSKNDTLLCAFPKSGGTWVRFFLFNLLNRLDGFEDSLSIDEMDIYMPEYGHPSIFEPWRYRSTSRIVKNHNKANLLTKGHRVVLLVRDPRSVAVSYYWYANGHRSFEDVSSIAESARNPRYGLEAAMVHYSSWKQEAGIVLKYETLLEDPISEFRRLCDYLQLNVNDDLVAEVLRLSSKESMRDAQKNSPKMASDFAGNYQFARKPSGKWPEMRSEADEALWQELRSRYGYNVYE